MKIWCYDFMTSNLVEPGSKPPQRINKRILGQLLLRFAASRLTVRMSTSGPSAASLDVGCLVARGVNRTGVRRVKIDVHDTCGPVDARKTPMAFSLTQKCPRIRLECFWPLILAVMSSDSPAATVEPGWPRKAIEVAHRKPMAVVDVRDCV